MAEVRDLAPTMKAKNSATRTAWWGQVKGLEGRASARARPPDRRDCRSTLWLRSIGCRAAKRSSLPALDVGQHQMWGAQFLLAQPSAAVA